MLRKTDIPKIFIWGPGSTWFEQVIAFGDFLYIIFKRWCCGTNSGPMACFHEGVFACFQQHELYHPEEWCLGIWWDSAKERCLPALEFKLHVYIIELTLLPVRLVAVPFKDWPNGETDVSGNHTGSSIISTARRGHAVSQQENRIP